MAFSPYSRRPLDRALNVFLALCFGLVFSGVVVVLYGFLILFAQLIGTR